MEENQPTYTVQKVLSIFGSSAPRPTVLSAESAGLIPKAKRRAAGSVKVRQWEMSDIPKLGARYGFMRPLKRPMVVTVFTTKGGVLKTTMAMNLARMAALHDIRTCVVGLDLQGDITNCLGFEPDVEDNDDVEAALERLNQCQGLADIHAEEANLAQVLQPTDIPGLEFIPETPELAMVEQGLERALKREYWLRDNITSPLKEHFDLIILDCSPNWNLLVTNALVACDILLCPLECKINNFRNFKVFKAFVGAFKKTLKLDFEQIFVPTRLTSTRKLSTSIRAWYMANIRGCTNLAIRESIQGEEALAAKLSLPEYAPKSIVADEMRELLLEVWSRIVNKAAADVQNDQISNREQTATLSA